MKKQFLLLVLLVGFFAQAQIDDSKTESQKDLNEFNEYARHEVSVDVLAAIVVPAINVRYEYILDRYSSVGGEVSVTLDGDETDFEFLETYSVTGFYRQYFFSKEDYGAKGFYGEGFLKGYGYKNEFYGFYNTADGRPSQEHFEMAIGVGIGWKWVSNSGFMIDLGFGIGRNLGIADDDYEDRDFTGRFGLNFGWRF